MLMARYHNRAHSPVRCVFWQEDCTCGHPIGLMQEQPIMCNYHHTAKFMHYGPDNCPLYNKPAIVEITNRRGM